MACPFSRNRQPSLAEVKSIVEEETSDSDMLTLKHLNAAIQLLTAPSVSVYCCLSFLYFNPRGLICFPFVERKYFHCSSVVENELFC